MNLINFFIFFKTPPKVKKEDPLKIPFKSLEARMKWDSRPKQKQDTRHTTRYAILINKTNRHNSLVARVPASSSVKGGVRYLFGATILTNFITVYLYAKKRPFTNAQTQFTCCHTYIKLVLFRSGCSFFRCFFFLLLEDEHRQNVPSGRRGEEKWLYSHGKTLVKFIQIHW